MQIAVIGSGISGMSAAYYLRNEHQVTVFESNSYLGGHTNTIDVQRTAGKLSVDTGFIVFNDRTYPNFMALLAELGVAYQPTSMSFSVSCEKTGLEYRGADLNGLFAQRINLFRPKFLHLLSEMLRFNRNAERMLAELNPDITVGDFFQRIRFGQEFKEKFFLPMASAIWSCPNAVVENFPMRFIVEFYRHHGLLSVTNRPQWYVIKGGSQQYMRKLVEASRARVLPDSPVASVERNSDSVNLTLADGTSHSFDYVIFACHSDQALKILGGNSTKTEREILGAFPYESNTAVLHTDERLLPKSRRAWACWNYHLPVDKSEKATVTYNMNMLQGLESPETFCVSLNCPERIRPEKVVKSIEYHHPIFTSARRQMQLRHSELIGENRTGFAGAYWGNGFHEDGVVSALKVCQSFEKNPWKVASTKAGFGTGDSRPSKTASALKSV